MIYSPTSTCRRPAAPSVKTILSRLDCPEVLVSPWRHSRQVEPADRLDSPSKTPVSFFGCFRSDQATSPPRQLTSRRTAAELDTDSPVTRLMWAIFFPPAFISWTATICSRSPSTASPSSIRPPSSPCVELVDGRWTRRTSARPISARSSTTSTRRRWPRPPGRGSASTPRPIGISAPTSSRAASRCICSGGVPWGKSRSKPVTISKASSLSAWRLNRAGRKALAWSGPIGTSRSNRQRQVFSGNVLYA